MEAVQQHQEQQHQPRNWHRHDNHAHHGQWVALVAFSIVALVSTTSRFTTDIQDETNEAQRVVSVVTIIILVSTLSCLAHFTFTEKCVGTYLEVGMSVVATGLWAAILPVIMDPDHSLAVTQYAGISNANLYFSSWAASAMSYFVMLRALIKCHSKWQDSSSRATRGTQWMWSGLVLTSFIAMTASVRMFTDGDCNDDSSDRWDASANDRDALLPTKDMCDRIKVSIGLGTVSSVVALAWWTATNWFLSNMKDKTLDWLETVIAGLLFALWTFGVAYLTFDEEKSPALEQGNLYFSAWSSWGLLLFLSSKLLQQVTMKSVAMNTPTEETVINPLKDNGAPLEPVYERDAATHATHDDKPGETDEVET